MPYEIAQLTFVVVVAHCTERSAYTYLAVAVYSDYTLLHSADIHPGSAAGGSHPVTHTVGAVHRSLGAETGDHQVHYSCLPGDWPASVRAVAAAGHRMVVAGRHMIAAAGHQFVVEMGRRIVGKAEHRMRKAQGRRMRKRAQYHRMTGVYRLWCLRLYCHTEVGKSLCSFCGLEGTYAFVDTTEKKLGVPEMLGQGEALGCPFTVFHLEICSG